MIYVTVGTMFMDFPRLIRAMDAIAKDTGERVVVQRGMGETRPEHCEHFDFKPHNEVLALQREAMQHLRVNFLANRIDPRQFYQGHK